jgi:outer membrane protein OmpA-like peptidoglycan-associated protein
MALAPVPHRADPAADPLGELRAILIGAEARRLDGVESELRALALSRLSRADLKSATAGVLADALREAEVKNHRALADALAPLIVRAIQSEIRNSRDDMVEALYPIVGRLVSASVADGIRRITENIAERIDALISARRWTWRAKSLLTGRSVAEIALAESQRARVLRVLCLERGSGQLIAIWPEAEADGRSEMMSGLIAAITEFAATTFAQEGGALRALDLGARRVLLRSSATLIVAAECDGVLRPQDESAIDDAFLELLATHERVREIAPPDLAGLDAALAGTAPPRKAGGAARWALRLVALCLAGWLIWTGGWAVVNWTRERRFEQGFAAARARAPAAAGYPLRLSVDHRGERVALIGLAPSARDRDRLIDALRPVVAPYALTSDVEIVAPAEGVGARLDDVAARLGGVASRLDDVGGQTRGVAERMVEADAAAEEALAAQRAATERARLAADAARAALAADIAAARAAQDEATRGLAADLAQAKAALAGAREEAQATRALLARVQEQVALIQQASNSPQARLNEALRTSAVFFIRGSAAFAEAGAADSTASLLAGLMKETGARLRIVGHTDDSGSVAANQRLSRARAEAIVGLLTKRGVPADQLVIVSKRSSALATDEGGAAANRRVTFELAPANEPGR